jgi:hypothetical protein
VTVVSGLILERRVLARRSLQTEGRRAAPAAGNSRFHGGEELFDAAEFFERQPLPSGRRIGIVSNTAGVATLAADACETRRLEVREASEAQNPLLMGIGAGPDGCAASVG